MFKIDDLKDKVSEYSIGDILLTPPSENDYYTYDEIVVTDEDGNIVSKYPEATGRYADEILEKYRNPINIRMPRDILDWTYYLVKKYKKQFKETFGIRLESGIVLKDACKLGALILQDYENNIPEIKKALDIYWFNEEVIRPLAENNLFLSEYLDEFWSIMLEKSRGAKSIWLKRVKKVQLLPYPRYRDILSRWGSFLAMTNTEIYLSAITLAYATEIQLPAYYKLIDHIYNYVVMITNTFRKCVSKYSTGFIKMSKEKEYIIKRLRGKKIDEEIKKIIEEVLLNE